MRLELTENHLIFGGTAIIAILLIVVLGFSGTGDSGPTIVDREDGVIQFSDGQTAPNASNITRNMARPEGPVNIQYRGEPFWREFMVVSYYMNHSGTLPIERPGPEGEELVTKMQALYNIYPDDGVINGYIVPVYQEDKERFRADIYIDQDFRDQVDGPVNIAWGNGTFSAFREYNFSEVFEGLYKDSVYFHNIRAIRYDVQTPTVAVGNFTEDDLNPDSSGYIAFYLR